MGRRDSDRRQRGAERDGAARRFRGDAPLLDLHGAMVVEAHDDPEGELLRRLRAVAPRVPIVVTIDFHGNFSAVTFQNADIVTGYRTYPHVDMYEAGERAGRTLQKMLRGEARPVV